MKRHSLNEWIEASTAAVALLGIGAYVAFPLLSYLARRLLGMPTP